MQWWSLLSSSWSLWPLNLPLLHPCHHSTSQHTYCGSEDVRRLSSNSCMLQLIQTCAIFAEPINQHPYQVSAEPMDTAHNSVQALNAQWRAAFRVQVPHNSVCNKPYCCYSLFDIRLSAPCSSQRCSLQRREYLIACHWTLGCGSSFFSDPCLRLKGRLPAQQELERPRLQLPAALASLPPWLF